MTLITSANFDENLKRGMYSPLAGVSKPMLEPIKDIAISSQNQVQTLVFSGDLVEDNTVDGEINGVAIDTITFDTDNETTLTALAAEIASFDGIVSAVSDGTDTITITSDIVVVLSDFEVLLGAGQADIAVAETAALIEASNGLISGTAVRVLANGTVSLATDNETHIVAGNFLELVNGTQVFTAIENLRGLIGAMPKGLARIQCGIKYGETLAAGDSASFENGVLVKTTTETNSYEVEAVEGDVAQIKFK